MPSVSTTPVPLPTPMGNRKPSLQWCLTGKLLFQLVILRWVTDDRNNEAFTHTHTHTRRTFQLLHELNHRQKNSKTWDPLFLPEKVAWLLTAHFNNQQENEIEKRERAWVDRDVQDAKRPVTELFPKKRSLHNLLVIWRVQQCLEVPPINTKPHLPTPDSL